MHNLQKDRGASYGMRHAYPARQGGIGTSIANFTPFEGAEIEKT
jgi:hypothetical protein